MTIMPTGASIDAFLIIMGGHIKEMIQLHKQYTIDGTCLTSAAINLCKVIVCLKLNQF